MRAGFFLAGSLGPDGVPLHAQRRGLKGVGAAPVVESIENDLDLVVVVDIFAARHAGTHLPGIVEAYKDYVEIFLVVAQISVRGLRHAFSVVRIALREAGDLGHLLGNSSLRLHAEEVFQGGRTRQARDGE